MSAIECKTNVLQGGFDVLQGGVGRIAEELVAGLLDHGGAIEYKANVREILTEGSDSENLAAKGVRLADGRVFRCACLAVLHQRVAIYPSKLRRCMYRFVITVQYKVDECYLVKGGLTTRALIFSLTNRTLPYPTVCAEISMLFR